MTKGAVLLCFDSETAFTDWLAEADAQAGLPDGKGTETLTYPMHHAGKIYCYVTEACPKEVLPSEIYETAGLVKGEDGIYAVNLREAGSSAILSFRENQNPTILLDNNP